MTYIPFIRSLLNKSNIIHILTADLNKYKANDNPIVSPVAGTYYSNAAIAPMCVYDNGTFHLFFTAYDGTTYRIGHGTGSDGIHFTIDSTPALDVTAGSFDSTHVSHPFVIKFGNTWYMYYSGSDGTSYRIGVATSTDLINWTKDTNNPILDLGTGWDSLHVMHPSIVYNQYDNRYYLYYTGSSSNSTDYFRIGLAISDSPAGPFVKYQNNPVITTGGSLEKSSAVLAPNVFYDNLSGIFYMFYSRKDSSTNKYSHIGIAISNDCINWTEIPMSQAQRISVTQSWESGECEWGRVLYVPDMNRWFIYYDSFYGNASGVIVLDI